MPDNKVMVETVRSIEAPLEANESAAEAALAYTMGLSWKSSVAPKDETLPFEPYNGDLDKLVSNAHEFNPDWAEVDAGLRALEGQQQTAATLSIFVAVMIPEQECDLRTELESKASGVAVALRGEVAEAAISEDYSSVDVLVYCELR